MAHAMHLLIIFIQVYLSFASRPYRASSATRSANVVASSFIHSLFARYSLVFPFGKGKMREKE